MSIDNAKTTLKVLGVLSIFFGVFGIGLAIILFRWSYPWHKRDEHARC